MSIYPRRNFLIRSELYPRDERALFNYSRFRFRAFYNFRMMETARSDISPVAKTDLLALLSSLLCLFSSFFFPPRPESFFASLCIFLFCLLVFLSLSLLAHHGVTSYHSSAGCHLHQAAGASSSGRQPPPLPAHASISTLARAHTRAHGRGTSPLRVRSAYRWIRMSRR